MEQAVQILAVLNLLVIGLSHLVQPAAWVEFFTALREKGRVGVFFVAFLSLGFGTLVVSLHSVWSGIPLLLTLYGWANVVKALVYFTAPQVGLRSLASIAPESTGRFRTAGVLLLALAAALGVHLVVLAGGEP